MATKRRGPDLVDRRPTFQEMQAGLRKIARRKEELAALDPNGIQQEDDEHRLDVWPPLWNDTQLSCLTRPSFTQRLDHPFRDGKC